MPDLKRGYIWVLVAGAKRCCNFGHIFLVNRIFGRPCSMEALKQALLRISVSPFDYKADTHAQYHCGAWKSLRLCCGLAAWSPVIVSHYRLTTVFTILGIRMCLQSLVSGGAISRVGI